MTLAQPAVLGTRALPCRPGQVNTKRDRCSPCSTPTSSTTPEFRTRVQAARTLIAERVRRGVATPAERLAVVVLDEMPDEDDPDAVRAWAPSAAFREAVRSAALATLALYVAWESLTPAGRGSAADARGAHLDDWEQGSADDANALKQHDKVCCTKPLRGRR